MQWVASTLHTTTEHVVSSITTADAAHLCCQQSTELTPPPADLNGLVRFARKTKSGFCACAVTFQLAPTITRLRNVPEERGSHLFRGGSPQITHANFQFGPIL